MGERARRVLVGFVVGVLVATGCSGGEQGSDVQGDVPRSGELRIAAGEDVWPLFGPGPRSRTFTASPNLQVYETLVALNSDYTLRPLLAERWEFVEPNTWRFHLRPGVTFHDGRRLTADDVVWSWTERELLPVTIANTLGPESVRKVDELTVDFTPIVPNLRLPEHLNTVAGAIVPQGRFMDSTPPIGTGPFRVVEYTPRREAVVERYDGYWGDKAKIERLRVRFYPDRQARMEALRDDRVDVVLDLAAEDAGAVERDPNIRLLRFDGRRGHVLFLNATGRPRAELMADKAVRRAVLLAVDRDAYVATALAGRGGPGRFLVPEAVLGPAAGSVPPARHDPAEAGRLLDTAGWTRGTDGVRTKGGRPLHLTLIGYHELPAGALAVVAEQLRRIGISTNVKQAADRLTYDEQRLRPFDLDLKLSGQGTADPSAAPAFWLSSDNPEASAFAVGGQLDELVAQVRSARSGEEIQRVSAAMLRVAEEEAIFTPIADVAYLLGVRTAVDYPNADPVTQDWTQVTVNR